MGHATAHAVLALESARKDTRAGDVTGYAHLIVRKWLEGVDEDLERAMRGLAKRMDEAQRSQALERARTMLRAIAQALADDPCAGGPGWV